MKLIDSVSSFKLACKERKDEWRISTFIENGLYS